jgi:hypothetical protein
LEDSCPLFWKYKPICGVIFICQSIAKKRVLFYFNLNLLITVNFFNFFTNRNYHVDYELILVDTKDYRKSKAFSYEQFFDENTGWGSADIIQLDV